jgi:hypothetical protein
MKTAIAVLSLAGAAFGNSININGVGSAVSLNKTPYGLDVEFSSSNRGNPHFYLALSSVNESSFTGGFSVAIGDTEYRMALPVADLKDNILSGNFTGFEYQRLGPRDWVYYAIAGTFTEGVNFTIPNQQATVDITQSTFLGPIVIAPEPSALMLMVTGILGMFGIRKRR